MLTQDNTSADDFFFLEERHPFWARAGQKAGNLARLWALGFRIPAGFAVPMSSLKTDFAEILDAVQQIGGFPVAVRSSGFAEDGEGASFAGQFESFLNVANATELKIAMTKCHSSFFSERVSEYSQKVGMTTDGDVVRGGAILVQKMVPASVSGVLFSIDPLSGNESEAVIEATEGLGQDILNGSKTPTTYWITIKHNCLKSSKICSAVFAFEATPSRKSAFVTTRRIDRVFRCLKSRGTFGTVF